MAGVRRDQRLNSVPDAENEPVGIRARSATGPIGDGNDVANSRPPPVKPQISLNLSKGPKKPKPGRLGVKDGGSASPGRKSASPGPNTTDGDSGFPPVSPRRLQSRVSAEKQQEQEAQLEEIRTRMGSLSFGNDQKKYQLSSERELQLVGRIGSGVTGEVFKIQHKETGVLMAAKKMVWVDDPEERKRILMDLRVMTTHSSPYIVQYYGSALWHNEVWVFMELMDTCLDRLLKKVGSFPERIVCKMTVSIVKALDYLKSEHQVIHRDVKPSNVLLDTHGNVKLCDFGISGRLVDSQAYTRNAGCAGYMAPERINVCTKGYDIRADIWSLGISLMELVMGSSPYNKEGFHTEFALLSHIVDAPPPLLDQTKFSPEFFDFVSQCLTKEVEKRPHYSDLLQHPLIQKYEAEDVDIGLWYQEVCRTHGNP